MQCMYVTVLLFMTDFDKDAQQEVLEAWINMEFNSKDTGLLLSHLKSVREKYLVSEKNGKVQIKGRSHSATSEIGNKRLSTSCGLLNR